MNKYLTIDEGHLFLNEDSIAYIKWKIYELISQGYSNETILLWEDVEIWKHYSKIFLLTLENIK
ncbi:MAG: hypothetical protein PHR79_10325 [Bacteroidales bacterium]|nr:hypothetical protein [Bacteroidales bacterium]